MHLGILIRIFRSHALLIFSILAITMLSAIAGSFLIDKVYKSSTELHVDVRSSDPITGQPIYTQQSPQQYLATQVEIIKSERVIRRVIDSLGLANHPLMQRIWAEKYDSAGDIRGSIAAELHKGLSVSPSIDGSTLSLTFGSTDPSLAADVVNAFATGYVATVSDLKSEPAKEASKWFEGEAGEARRNLDAAQHKLSTFQQTSGIVSSDERFDVENQRLNELSSQLVQLQSTAASASSRMDVIGKRGRESMPEVVSNALIQSLKTELSRADSRLKEFETRLGINNPQYISAQAEQASLRSRLKDEIDRVAGSIEADSAITLQRESMVRKQLDAQRTKVLKLKQERDRMSGLLREVDSAQKALDQLVQRFQDTKISSRASLTNVTVLSRGLVPTEPAYPKPLLNLVVGAFLGMLIGLLAALALEMVRRPVRTADDLFNSLGVPVLGVLPPSNSKRAQRLIGGGGPTMRPPTLRLGS